jgi:hypothetical protein
MKSTSELIDALDHIKSSLERISVDNGYNTSPQIKRGWLQHVFKAHSRTPVEFPVIAYRAELSDPQSSVDGNSNIKDSMTVVIDAAVSTKENDADEAVDSLLNLLKDLRRSLVFDPNNVKLKHSSLIYGECPFDLPDTGEEYAFFSQKIIIEVVEQYA